MVMSAPNPTQINGATQIRPGTVTQQALHADVLALLGGTPIYETVGYQENNTSGGPMVTPDEVEPAYAQNTEWGVHPPAPAGSAFLAQLRADLFAPIVLYVVQHDKVVATLAPGDVVKVGAEYFGVKTYPNGNQTLTEAYATAEELKKSLETAKLRAILEELGVGGQAGLPRRVKQSWTADGPGILPGLGFARVADSEMVFFNGLMSNDYFFASTDDGGEAVAIPGMGAGDTVTIFYDTMS